MLKRVRIFLSTERVGVAARLFEDMIEGASEADILADAMLCPPDEGEDEPQTTEMFSDARLRLTDDMFSLSYEESELTGMEGSVTSVGFQRADEGLVSMMRTGPVRTALTFEEKKRHFCIYRTPFSSFEVCVYTRRVENALLREGRLHLDYLMEIHGAQAERCRMTVTLRPVAEESDAAE